MNDCTGCVRRSLRNVPQILPTFRVFIRGLQSVPSLHLNSPWIEGTTMLPTVARRNHYRYYIPLLTLLICVTGLPTGNAAEPKQHRLYIMDRDGSNRKVLFEHDEYYSMGSPSMSPNGKFIAMDAWKSQNGEKSGNGVIITINSDGNGMKIVSPGNMPNWSPRGGSIVFSNTTNPRGVTIMRADGTNKKLLDSSGWSGQWSPNGHMIAYISFGENRNIHVYDLIEDEYHTVFPPGETPYSRVYWNIKWSPDSKRLCVKVKREDNSFQIITVNAWADDPGVKVHFNTKVEPYVNFAWNPTGKPILFGYRPPGSAIQKLFGFDPSTTDEPVPFEHQDPRHVSGDMCWSHDGTKLLYVARDD